MKKIPLTPGLLALLQIFDHRTGCKFARMANAERCLRQHDAAIVLELCRPESFNLPEIAAEVEILTKKAKSG